MRLIIVCLAFALLNSLGAQETSIHFELNGRLTNDAIQEVPAKSQNPFAKFIGEWTLKDDLWMQNWGGANDTIKIPKHHTVCSKINTENSLLSIIDGPEPNGHIFWSYNPNTKEVGHLSSFGSLRAGTGSGAFYGAHNLRLKVQFEGEPAGTYRIYTYEWINDDEYALNSIQYDANDQPTGLFYKGNFVRVHPSPNIEEEIKTILKVLDDHKISKEEQLVVYADSIIHMAPNHRVITNKADLLAYLKTQQTYGRAEMEHKIVDYSKHGDIVIMRGKVEGTFYPSNGGDGVPFTTKNLFVFTRVDGALKVAKIIYNMTPNS